MPFPSAAIRRVVLVSVAALAAGCAPEPAVRSYSVPREADHKPFRPAAVLPEAKYRMLAAVIPVRENLNWFVRCDGPIERVNEAERDFDAFLTSVRVTGPASPTLTWTVPAGWRVGPPKAMRLVTLQKGDEKKPLEIYISEPIGGTMLGNVNRWRTDFVGIKPWSDEDLAEGLKEVKLGGTPAYKFDFVGPGGAKAGGPGGRPFGSTN